jgi:hypothetical protein
MSGSSGAQKAYTPEVPKPPTLKESIGDWLGSMPQIYQAQQTYAPLEAQQQLAMLQQYGLPLSQQYKSIQEALYPTTSGLQENLAKQATEGMTAKVPDWMQQQYLSDMRANLGENVASPIAADYQSRGLMQMQKDFNDYYRNLAVSVASAQPLVGAQTPGYTNYMSSFSPSAATQYNAQNYGTYAQALRPMALDTGTPNWIMGMQAGGNLLQGLGSAAAASSKKLKKKIKKVNDSLNKVLKLQGVEFVWKKDNKPDGGFIAEEVEKVMPEAVREVDGIKCILPLVIMSHIVEAIKEIAKEQHGNKK